VRITRNEHGSLIPDRQFHKTRHVGTYIYGESLLLTELDDRGSDSTKAD